MSAITTQPGNINFLSPVGFDFKIKRLPTVNFFVQSVLLPGIQLGVATRPTPFKMTYEPGDRPEFSDLQLTFKIDEDMKNYIEVFNWMIALGFPDSYDQYSFDQNNNTISDNKPKSQGTLTILNNSMVTNIQVNFEDLFPISLSDVPFDTRDASLEYLEATATFKFNSYKFSVNV